MARRANRTSSDGGGLHLFVTAKGYKSWRLKCRFQGKKKRLMFGPYPEVPLAEARDKRDAARRLLRDDVDAGVETEKRKEAAAIRAATTFACVLARTVPSVSARLSTMKRRRALGLVRPDEP